MTALLLIASVLLALFLFLLGLWQSYRLGFSAGVAHGVTLAQPWCDGEGTE